MEWPDILMALTIGIIVLAQIKWDYQPLIRKVMYAIWIICFAFLMLDRMRVKKTNFGILFLTSTVCIYVYCSVLDSIGGGMYSNSLMKAFMPISCFAYWLGVIVASGDMKETTIKVSLITYFISSTIFSIVLRIFFFSDISSWLSSNVYTYGVGKNQVGMVLASAALVGIVFVWPMCINIIEKVATVFGILLCYYGVALVQSRTAIIASFICISCYFYLQGKIKIRYVIPIVLIAIVAFTNDSIAMFWDHVFFISKYADKGSNAFFSGRLDSYKHALDLVKNDLLFGIGNYYVDCLYVQVLVEGGIIECLLVIPLVLFRLKNGFKYFVKNLSLNNLALVLAIYYFVTSFLEAQTPFGPGTSACIFWIVSGYVDVTKKNHFKKYMQAG